MSGRGGVLGEDGAQSGAPCSCLPEAFDGGVGPPKALGCTRALMGNSAPAPALAIRWVQMDRCVMQPLRRTAPDKATGRDGQVARKQAAC